ncbi:hypothetical protein [Streptomyces sp. NPDC046925]|uniref:hypothetical protein n=1 Tax=Streptomyces sp. NPDC046925 TaxID=3155375 RepID=UPI0033FD7F89
MSAEKAPKYSQDSSGHVMLLAVVLTVPVLKLAWTLGGGNAARDALIAMGPGNWPDVLIGMFLNEPLLATVLAVVVSRATYAYFAAKGGALRHQGVPLPVTAAAAAVVPVGLAVVIGAFNGLAWGLFTGVIAYLLRVAVVIDYTTGRRVHATGRRSGRRAETPLQRAADVIWIAGLLLAGVVLPVIALLAALDGRAWTSVENCNVNTGQGIHRARLIELERQGDGIVGWDVAASEVVNGINCAGDENETIRPAWWREA